MPTLKELIERQAKLSEQITAETDEAKKETLKAEMEMLNIQISEAKAKEVEETTKGNSVGENDLNKKSKTFTQDELDGIIKARLAKEKAEIESLRKQVSEHNSKIKEIEFLEKSQKIQEFDEIIKKRIRPELVEDVKNILGSKYLTLTADEIDNMIVEKFGKIPGAMIGTMKLDENKINVSSVNNQSKLESKKDETGLIWELDGNEYTQAQYDRMLPAQKMQAKKIVKN